MISNLNFSSMKLNAKPKIYDPMKKAAETYGKIPTPFDRYILRNQVKENDDDGTDDDEDLSREHIEIEKINEALGVKTEDNNELYSQVVTSKLKDEQFPRILFLGTSSGDSFLLRNSSGALVHMT